jgi:hypothetical protein
VIGNLGMAHMGMSMHSLIESSNQIKSNRMYIVLKIINRTRLIVLYSHKYRELLT